MLINEHIVKEQIVQIIHDKVERYNCADNDYNEIRIVACDDFYSEIEKELQTLFNKK